MTKEDQLTQIRSLMQESRNLLGNPDLDPKERQALENTLAGLHSTEHLILLQQTFADIDFKPMAKELQQLSKSLREIARRLNQKAKAYDQLEQLIRNASLFISQVAKWI